MTSNSVGERKIFLVLEGKKVSVPANEPIVYFAEAYTDTSTPYPSHVYVSAHQDAAWKFLRETIANGGYGHVIVYDVTLIARPQRLKCIGRIDSPTQDPVIP
ncbi:hypothetical protein [Streptosporangium jomthongense]|uniref:Uncharacterized protein n=1 Tax=Streptosporangium jomthongense TaxID=1193683 RepID=A0ABV8F0W0_9ACTN